MKKDQIKNWAGLPLLAATVGNLIWGFSNAFTQVALTVASPSVVLAIRFLLAILVMSFFILSGKEKIDFRKPKLLYLVSLGIVELCYFYCESYGIVYTNVTCSGVVLAISPVVAIAMAAAVLKEIPTRKQVFFSFVAVAGVIMITVAEGMAGEIQPIGILLLLGGCLFSAVFRIINRSICGIYTTFERTYMVLLVSAVSFTIMALIEEKGKISVFLSPIVEPKFMIPVAILGICSSVGANLMVNYAAERLPIVRLAVFGAISTICSMVGGILFLGEPLTVMALVGAVLILTGIWQVNKNGENS
ncbi:MAG: DMT family transporter [Lachnospiraceae bacterium]|nr:DMT family transporter [Lachnospiraceae bacterium]